MQQSLNCIPSPEISHIVNFMLTYMELWYSVTQGLSLFLPRFHLYANAIVGRDSRIGAGGINCRVAGFTDGTLIQTCRPQGNGNIFKQIHDFQQFDGKSKQHGHKFLGLSFPDGLIVIYGLYAGGKTGVTTDRDKIEFRLFNSSSIFNITLREELFSSPKQNQTIYSCPGFMALVT